MAELELEPGGLPLVVPELYPSSSFHQSFFNNSMRGIFRLSLQRRPKLTGGQLKVSRL